VIYLGPKFRLDIGFHLPISDSLDKTVDCAIAMECTTFQIFSRNPRGWKFKPLDLQEVSNFRKRVIEHAFSPLFVHMPYLPNLASPREKVYALSIASLMAELKRCETLGIPFLVTHLGSHLGMGKALGAKRIIEAINCVFSKVENNVMLLLENTSGTRNSMGSSFEDISRIIDGVEDWRRVGICFDTCHAFAAGYDLREEGDVNRVIERLDDVLGWETLKLVHLNDSKGGFRSGIDRHEHIGLGKIGEQGFKNILQSELRNLPLIMETPIDSRRGDLDNLKKVQKLTMNQILKS
jgi:deoxyribonuclease-4